jgi:hypothetical protein
MRARPERLPAGSLAAAAALGRVSEAQEGTQMRTTTCPGRVGDSRAARPTSTRRLVLLGAMTMLGCLPAPLLSVAHANPSTLRNGFKTRLLEYSRENPLPDVAISSIDFVSSMTEAGPFLVAVTVR